MKKAGAMIGKFPLEAAIWLTALIALALYNPDTGSHFSLCPLSALGFDYCPGCGLGRSISHIFHGRVITGFQTHPLGLFAIIVLSYRVITLVQKFIKKNKQNNNHGECNAPDA